MTDHGGFEQIREQEIPELKTKAELYRHVKTGAEVLSLINDDENKVFGITFRTPPSDSTGVAHILEHSVLCGSRKYPIKEPFVELLKSSLQTFLNAMTYPDRTCYPVASQNVKDFYNLIDVYLDAVLYPHLTPFIFQQEGWHFELESANKPLIYKGVVFNEMKGAYSSPDNLLTEYSRRSLFPDNPYGFDSGGDPRQIPDLTFEQFKAFHEKYYHPSNARIYFYGDDDPTERLRILDGFLKDFERTGIDSRIPIQPLFDSPRRLTRSFAAGGEDDRSLKGMVTLNWLLDVTTQRETNLALHMLEYILLGMPGSPLRKALIDSNLGEDIAGQGLGTELYQMYFSTGLKGIHIKDAERIAELILETLTHLAKKGIDPHTTEAALNTIEFSLRENNTGGYPRGLVLMLRAITTWLYDDDPLALIAFEEPLETLKSRLASNRSFFEEMIDGFFIHNLHRTMLILKPDPQLSTKEEADERERLATARKAMGQADLQRIVTNTLRLQQIQEAPDTPEALATIPTLKLRDLDRKNKTIPFHISRHDGTPILFHDLFTNGIAYLDLGFNLHVLPQKYLQYVRLFGRSLLEMGTEREDYVTLTQRISRKTGGIRPAYFTSIIKDDQRAASWLFLRGKAMEEQAMELLNILRDILHGVRLDNKERFRQIVLEAKARQEEKLIPSGHQFVDLRLRSHFNEADWATEQMNGVSYLFFLRKLAKDIEEDWSQVLTDLEEVHGLLVNGNAMVLNVTLDEARWSRFHPRVLEFLETLPKSVTTSAKWSPGGRSECEGMTIPAQVNYVGKGSNIYQLGYRFHGSVHVISRYLRNVWLWDRVRVQGGAYGAFCLFDRLSGILTFVSYRDPNLSKTLDTFDKTAQFLRNLRLNGDELTKGIVGTIGGIDKYRLPDAKGYTSMVRHLSGETDEDRQRMREEVLGTATADFKAFASVLDALREKGLVKILGSQSAIKKASSDRPGWLHVLQVL